MRWQGGQWPLSPPLCSLVVSLRLEPHIIWAVWLLSAGWGGGSGVGGALEEWNQLCSLVLINQMFGVSSCLTQLSWRLTSRVSPGMRGSLPRASSTASESSFDMTTWPLRENLKTAEWMVWVSCQPAGQVTKVSVNGWQDTFAALILLWTPSNTERWVPGLSTQELQIFSPLASM